MKIDPVLKRLRPDQRAEVETVRQIRTLANQLRESASKGQYSDADFEKFLILLSQAPLALHMSNPEISERAALGATFFSSAAREKRRPKLVNMLKVLSTIIDVADERLAEVDAIYNEQLSGVGLSSGWIPNKLVGSKELKQLQELLIQLIQRIKESNSLSLHKELDNVWRKNLIVLLETTLALLKGPLVEKSMIRSSAKALKKVAQTIGEHASAGFVGALAGTAATALLALL